jgi:ABC-type proline/glycine betaine transport system permease subunit
MVQIISRVVVSITVGCARAPVGQVHSSNMQVSRVRITSTTLAWPHGARATPVTQGAFLGAGVLGPLELVTEAVALVLVPTPLTVVVVVPLEISTLVEGSVTSVVRPPSTLGVAVPESVP